MFGYGSIKVPTRLVLEVGTSGRILYFPNNYFHLILHNHMLEHIPGDYQEHIASFQRLLHPGGHMVFTVPSISYKTLSVQGGEHLLADTDRIRLYGQRDHYKTFGYDLIEYFSQLSGMIHAIEIPIDVRNSIRSPHDSVFVWTKY